MSKQGTDSIEKRMFFLLIIGIIPLFIILIIHLNNPDALILNEFAATFKNLPTITSNKSLLMSKAMDIYCKASPLLALLFIAVSYRHFEFKKIMTTQKLVWVFILFSVLYFTITILLLAHNKELNDSRNWLKVISENDYLLTFFYISIFSVCYIFTVYYLSFIISFFKGK
ncbi:colicin immunity protein Cui [Pectobacterium parmentieri]|uniref:Colicin immunity protein n=1 Tax=Pectobacterium parmentieri TaxID=1905730 RepID=A0A8B3F976_PECPM|nr:colicin immunity protein Cui [Pectobacterium parmentieri]AOR58821.1 hypothetical protein A8F97_07855 [Pectobacterium parmentieri]AYH10144.1 hypothetical protein C5E24_10855 [Pectobacterium parmentieri]AYH19145.1 hypothetical protein C5E22_11935 [Pectobacterium parmentieri]AYH36463.1 hypothetical protein C5E17_10800 [Pectobacterium parmentieri]AZS56569.1 hypothetical protein C5E18_10800 [Pectobacterium parmentieri]